MQLDYPKTGKLNRDWYREAEGSKAEVVRDMPTRAWGMAPIDLGYGTHVTLCVSEHAQAGWADCFVCVVMVEKINL